MDVRADGGYVVAPPSVHETGKHYQWEVPISGNLPKLPAELYRLITSGSNHNGDGERERFDSSVVWEGIPEGQRDDELFRYACQLRSYNAPRDVADRLILEAAALCRPPLPTHDALKKVQQAYRYEPGHSSNAAANANSHEKNADKKAERTPLTVRISEVQRRRSVLAMGKSYSAWKLAIIEGDPGEGKTFVSQAMAAAISRGFGLRHNKAGNVLINRR